MEILGYFKSIPGTKSSETMSSWEILASTI